MWAKEAGESATHTAEAIIYDLLVEGEPTEQGREPLATVKVARDDSQSMAAHYLLWKEVAVEETTEAEAVPSVPAVS